MPNLSNSVGFSSFSRGTRPPVNALHRHQNRFDLRHAVSCLYLTRAFLRCSEHVPGTGLSINFPLCCFHKLRLTNQLEPHQVLWPDSQHQLGSQSHQIHTSSFVDLQQSKTEVRGQTSFSILFVWHRVEHHFCDNCRACHTPSKRNLLHTRVSEILWHESTQKRSKLQEKQS